MVHEAGDGKKEDGCCDENQENLCHVEENQDLVETEWKLRSPHLRQENSLK